MLIRLIKKAKNCKSKENPNGIKCIDLDNQKDIAKKNQGSILLNKFKRFRERHGFSLYNIVVLSAVLDLCMKVIKQKTDTSENQQNTDTSENQQNTDTSENQQDVIKNLNRNDHKYMTAYFINKFFAKLNGNKIHEKVDNISNKIEQDFKKKNVNLDKPITDDDKEKIQNEITNHEKSNNNELLKKDDNILKEYETFKNFISEFEGNIENADSYLTEDEFAYLRNYSEIQNKKNEKNINSGGGLGSTECGEGFILTMRYMSPLIITFSGIGPGLMFYALLILVCEENVTGLF